MATNFFSNASNARRAAKARGYSDYTVERTAQGFALIVAAAAAVTRTVNTSGDQLGGTVAPDSLPLWAKAPAVITQPAATAKAPAHKAFANYAHSTLGKPVAYVHEWLGSHGNGMSRKAALATLCEAGINYSTARTQYQVWFGKQRAAA